MSQSPSEKKTPNYHGYIYKAIQRLEETWNEMQALTTSTLPFGTRGRGRIVSKLNRITRMPRKTLPYSYLFGVRFFG